MAVNGHRQSNSPSGAIVQREMGAWKASPSRHSRALPAAASGARGRGSGGARKDCPAAPCSAAAPRVSCCSLTAITPEPAPAASRPGGSHDRWATISRRIAADVMKAVMMLVGLRWPDLTGERPAAAQATAIALGGARQAPGR